MTVSAALARPFRGRGVTAVLGPTNTGKTHLAIERMLGHDSGMIGLPLRLLAREVYNRLVGRAGVDAVALVTGEETIKPAGARYWVATMEALPRDLNVSFLALDEIQLAADFDRGHVFTDHLLNRRGTKETLVLGAATMRPLVEKLLPGVNIITRPRLSQLLFAGEKKITRLPPRSAVVAFSAQDVYAIAELIRRQRGGAAVVLGALSPRTRNAQVELFQSGDVEHLVATDAIGMGLNLDLDHVAFAGDSKFDGFQFRKLNPAELGQIAGRAGRHLRDGTFGTTGRCPPFDEELVEHLEAHRFDAVRLLQWRNPDLAFGSVPDLLDSLAQPAREDGLVRAPASDDALVLEAMARDHAILDLAQGEDAVKRLWQVCQVPDYRKISPAQHADLLATLYNYLMRDGVIATDWFAGQVARCDRTEGDIDTLSARIAQIRTWTFVANRPDWLKEPGYWEGMARQVEDRLSDALHERLTQRFVDRRTSVLMRRLKEKSMIEAEITSGGDVQVEGHHVGRLAGFQFTLDPQSDPEHAKALKAAAVRGLAQEFERRADRLSAAPDPDLAIASDGVVRWLGDPVGRLAAGDTPLSPRVLLIADDELTGPARDKVQARLDLRVGSHIRNLLGPLFSLRDGPGLEGMARGIAYQLAEAYGVMERAQVADEVKALEQNDRAALRALGVRFGAYHIYVPTLLKPAPRALSAQLWLLHSGMTETAGLDDAMALAASGRTSFPVDPQAPKQLYRVLGFRVCGGRAVRVDILERLADLIRPAIAYRPGISPGEAPAGAADGDGFMVTVAMTSLVGCAGEDFSAILRALGYRLERVPAPAAAPVSASENSESAAPVASDAEAAPAEGGALDAPDAVADAVADVTPDPAVDAVPAEEGAAAEAVAEAAPAMLEIWHPGGRREGRSNRAPRTGDGASRARHDGPRRDEARKDRGERSGHGKPRHDGSRHEGPRKGKGGRKPDHEPRREAPRRERQPDPDSPFAALAALKSRLTVENSGQ